MTAMDIIKNSAPTDISDREALTAILNIFTSCKNPEETSRILLLNLGTLKNVLESDPQALRNYTSAATTEKLTAILPIVRLYTARNMETPKQIANRKELEIYCKSLLTGKQHEEFWVICVNAQARIIGQKRISTGTTSEVNGYPREVMKAALEMNAHSVFITHNHPGGTCAPSNEDIQTTRILRNMLTTVGILTLDHMIIAGENAYSMAQHGDLERR